VPYFRKGLVVNSEKEQIKIWRRNFPLFVEQIFKVKPTGQQLEFLSGLCEMVWAKLKLHTWNTKGKEPYGSITDRDRKLNSMFGTSIMSGVGTGKGTVASWLIIWFLTCFPNPKIVVTSSSAKQLGITLWAELAKWHDRCALKDWFTLQSDKFYLTEKEGKTWFAATRTANTKNSPDEQAETLAGLHEDFLLIIADEASGIPDPVFRPLESTLTRKCNLCCLFFNPTKSKGFAIDTHYKDRDNWFQFRWDAELSPQVTKDSIERLSRKYGRDSNTFRIRVKGLPPTSGENHIIPWDYIESAVDKELEPLADDILMYSLDVGAGGDDNVILPIRGPVVLPLMVSNSDDSRVLTSWAVDKVAVGEPRICLVDNIGVGWAVVGSLREKIPADACDIIEVNVANTAFNPHRYFRLRDELWWRLRESFEAGQLSIPNDALLMGDLNSPRYEEVAGKIKVETKKDMKTRGIDSPNRADALMMTRIYTPDVLRKLHEMGGLGNHKKKKKSNVTWRTL
jgi:hypothetical protein